MTSPDKERLDGLREELASVLQKLDEGRRAAKGLRWCPHNPTSQQSAFLALDSDDALFGGQVGGGKSDALLMGALQLVDTPLAATMLFRRSFRDLALPGALMDRAGQWLRPTAAHWSELDKTWTFPSGATLTFGYAAQHAEVYRYQGSELTYIAIDEVTQWEKRTVQFLRTRLRRLKGFPIPPHSRCASNPGGIGHEWVKARYVIDGAPYPFIPASLWDNPFIDAEDYARRLQDLDPTTRAQLLEGKWIQDTSTLIYPVSEANILACAPELGPRWHFGLGVDLGASLDKPTTAFVVVGYNDQLAGVFVLQSEKHAGMTVSTVAERILELRMQYGGLDHIVVDEGALGLAYSHEFRSRYLIHTDPASKRDKRGFRRLLQADIINKRIMFIGPMCKGLIKEMAALRWADDGQDAIKGSVDHESDALLYIWRNTRAYQVRAPRFRPRPDSPEAFRIWEEQEIEKERRDHRRAQQPDDWWH